MQLTFKEINVHFKKFEYGLNYVVVSFVDVCSQAIVRIQNIRKIFTFISLNDLRYKPTMSVWISDRAEEFARILFHAIFFYFIVHVFTFEYPGGRYCWDAHAVPQEQDHVLGHGHVWYVVSRALDVSKTKVIPIIRGLKMIMQHNLTGD